MARYSDFGTLADASGTVPGWSGANTVTIYDTFNPEAPTKTMSMDEYKLTTHTDRGEWDIPKFDIKPLQNLVNKKLKENNTMSSNNKKYYRTLKDLPTIEQGAILEAHYGDDYSLYDLLWEKDNVPEDESVSINKWNVEGSPDFYERVYKIGDTDTFGTKEQAKAVLEVSVTPGENAS